MDQLVLQWLANRETNRHNIATEKEALRHNYQTENLQRMQIYSNERIQAANRAAQMSMNTYTANKHLEGSKYSADASRAASEFATRTNAWQRQYQTMVEAATKRQANLIQSNYNRGQLAIATARAEEEKRANRAREEENRASRLQNADLRMKELEYNYNTLEYSKERDAADRLQRAEQHSDKMRAEYTKQAIDLLEVGSKWYTAVKGVKRVNVTETKKDKENVFEKALDYLTKQGR